MNNILIESQQHEFLADGFPRPVSFIRRFSQGFHRFYYTLSKTGEVTIYSSATTLIKDGYAEDTLALEAWRNKLRAEGKNPEYELNYAATRGTLMHTLIGDYIQQIEINLDNIAQHFFDKHPDISIPYMSDVFTKDSIWLVKAVLAFAQFAKDFKVKPLALELLMKSDKYMVASPIDMICEMEIEEKGFFGEVYKTGEKKGQPKESKKVKKIIAIVDFKSSQNGFYDKHYFQLQLYKRMVEENHKNIVVEGLFNWSPKDWQTSPTYNLKEQSDGKLNALCETVFEQGKIKHSWKTPTVTTYKNTISMATFEEGALFENIPLKDYLEAKHGEDKRTEETTEQTDK